MKLTPLKCDSATVRQRIKRSEWLTTCCHEASHAVAAMRLGQPFDYIFVNPYNDTKGGMVADEGGDPKVTAIVALQGCLFERWLYASPVGSDGDVDWEIALECGWSLCNDGQLEVAIQRLLPLAEQLFQQHFDETVTLGEALRKRGRGGRMTEIECKEVLAAKAGVGVRR